MTKSKRFKPIVKVAQSRENAAARVLGESRQTLSAQEVRLADLKSYRDEYVESFNQAGGKGMSIEHMRNYRTFLESLDKAIAQQEIIVNTAVDDVDKEKSNWMDKSSRRKVLDKVVDKFLGMEQRSLEKSEQRELDDRAHKPLQK